LLSSSSQNLHKPLLCLIKFQMYIISNLLIQRKVLLSLILHYYSILSTNFGIRILFFLDIYS